MKKKVLFFNLFLLVLCTISFTITFFGNQKLDNLDNKKNDLTNKIQHLKKENSSLNEKNTELINSKNHIEKMINNLEYN